MDRAQYGEVDVVRLRLAWRASASLYLLMHQSGQLFDDWLMCDVEILLFADVFVELV